VAVVGVMQVAIVQVVDVALVPYRDVPAVRSVLVVMSLVYLVVSHPAALLVDRVDVQ